MVVLGLNCPIHFQFATILTQIGAAHELLVQSLRTHVLLDAIYDFNDVLYVLLELFADLQLSLIHI